MIMFSTYLEHDDELWIGLNDIKIHMYFEWTDGTPVTFTKWLPGEPSHEQNRQEDCTVMKGQVRHLQWPMFTETRAVSLIPQLYLVIVSVVSILASMT